MGLQLEHHHLKMGQNAQCLYNFVFNHIDFMLFSNLIVISLDLLLVLRIFSPLGSIYASIYPDSIRKFKIFKF